MQICMNAPLACNHIQKESNIPTPSIQRICSVQCVKNVRRIGSNAWQRWRQSTKSLKNEKAKFIYSVSGFFDVSLPERSKGSRSGRDMFIHAWVQTPQLTFFFLLQCRSSILSFQYSQLLLFWGLSRSFHCNKRWYSTVCAIIVYQIYFSEIKF